MTDIRSKIGALVLGVAAVTAMGCTVNTHATLAQAEQTGIAVNGTGRVTVVPDIGVLSLGVQSTQPTVAAARTEAAKAMDLVRASLKQNAIDDKDVATSSSTSSRNRISAAVRQGSPATW